MVEDKPYIRINLVDMETGKEYFSLGVMADRSKTPSCPRIFTETILPFSLEGITDPLGYPAPTILIGNNPFRVRPCNNCDKVVRKGEFTPEKGSRNEFKCTAYNGRVIEIGYYPNKTSQQNLPNIFLE